MKKRLFCIVLSCVMLLAAFPVFAAGNDVTVAFTLTRGADVYTADGVRLAQRQLRVPYFDLALYGLQDYYYNPDCYAADGQPAGTQQTANGVVTLLHLMLFATEVYQCGLAPDDAGQGYLADSGMMDELFSLSGKVGSSFMTLWDFGTNFNYFVNRAMPLGREGWMATSDQIALHDGDSVHVHGLIGSAGGSNLQFFRMDADTFDTASVDAHEQVRLTLLRRKTDLYTSVSSVSPQADEAVYCADAAQTGAIRTWRQIGSTDENGVVTFSAASLGAGTYCIAAAGSDDKTAGMQNTPAVFSLTVRGSEIPAQAVPVVLEGMHEMQVNSMKLYTWTDGVKGTRDLLSGVTLSDDMQYTLSLTPGEYWAEGYDKDGRLNGGLLLRVAADGGNTFPIRRVYAIYAQNSGWEQDKDYSVYVSVVSPDGRLNRHASLGTADDYGTLRASCLFLAGDTIRASFVPLGEKAKDYLAATVEKKGQYNTDLRATVYSAATCTFTAPAGSVISVGRFANYYVYDFYDAAEQTVTGDGRVQATFRIPAERVNATAGPNFFVRVQNPQGITYWDFFDPASTAQREITAQQLYIGDAQFNAHTVLHNFENNTYDMADLYLNGNAAGCIPLEPGERFSLNAFRNWMAIENFFNAKVALPDMHYRVIDENGRDSDLLTVTPDPHNSCQATVTANGSGTAILLVTYDAMFSEQAYTSGTPNRPNLFSAIWPENTGVLVFCVGGKNAPIETGMTLNGTGEKNRIDAEHDPIFFTGDGGASYTFTPETGCTVSVNRPLLTDVMTFRGFTADGVLYNADGSVTVTGLPHGRSIIQIEKNGSVTYQVITAKQMSYTLLDADGNALADNAVLHAGDTVQVQYTGLTNPVEKMSGVYNHNARIWFKGEDGTTFDSVAGGAWGVYDFSGNPERQRLTVTIPRYWAGETYTLSGGVIAMRISGSVSGSHRGVAYGRGMDPNFHAESAGAAQGSLPDLTFRLVKTEFLTASVFVADAKGEAIDLADLTIRITDADGVEVPVREDGSFDALPGTYSVFVSGEGIAETSIEITVAHSGETFTIAVERIEPAPQPDETTVWQRFVAVLKKIWYYLTWPFRKLYELIKQA